MKAHVHLAGRLSPAVDRYDPPGKWTEDEAESTTIPRLIKCFNRSILLVGCAAAREGEFSFFLLLCGVLDQDCGGNLNKMYRQRLLFYDADDDDGQLNGQQQQRESIINPA